MVKTRAIRITENSYDVAVACLAAGFATIPKEKVLDHWLIINALESEQMEREGVRPYLVLGNSWMTQADFMDMWKPVNEAITISQINDFTWVEVERC